MTDRTPQEQQQIAALVKRGWPDNLAEMAVDNPGVRMDAIGSPGMSEAEREKMGLDGTADDFILLVKKARERLEKASKRA